MSLAALNEFLDKLLTQILDQWFDESAKVWDEFLDKISDAWTPGVSFWVLVLTPSALSSFLLSALLSSLDAVQELIQDLGLVPHRIAVDVVDDLVPVPDAWKGRVVRADQMLRFLVRESLEFGVDIVDLDLPAILNVAEYAGKATKLAQVVDKTRAMGERVGIALKAARASVVVAVIKAVFTIFKWTALVVLALWAANTLWRAHGPEGQIMIDERALPQNSKRVRRDRGVRQFRVNTRPGKD